MFDIQRTMREAYDRARRLLFESNSASTHVNDISSAVTTTTSHSNTGHRDDCPSTCTCFLVCISLRLFPPHFLYVMYIMFL